MNRTRTILVVALLVVGLGGPMGPIGVATAADCTFPVSSTDATGTNVTIQDEPRRIVTLNPSATQTMWEIGAEGKVVGLTPYASYLGGTENRTNVWSQSSVNVEAVIALDPDLVLAPNTIPDDTVEQLRGAGLTVYEFETATSTEFVAEKTILTGRLVGECDGARSRADEMRREVETIDEAVDGVDRPRVLYTFFGWTAGEGTFIDTIITTAGGRNVAAEAGITGYAKISEEVVVSRDPEWIVLNSDNPTVPDSQAYEQTTAVRAGNTVTVDANYISQPAPRIVQPMLTIVRALHPDEYEVASRGVEEVREDDEEDLPPPEFSITSTAMDVSRVELYDSATISVNVTNEGGPGDFEANLYLNDSLKDTTYTDVAGGGSASIRLQHTFGSWGRYEVRVNDRRIGTVSVVRDRDPGVSRPNDTETAGAPEMSVPNADVGGNVVPATETPAPTTTETDPPSTGTTSTADESPDVTVTARSRETVHEPASLPGFTVTITLLSGVLLTVGLLVRRRA